MKAYQLIMAGGELRAEITGRSDEAVIAVVMAGNPRWIAAEQWDADGYDNNDQPCKRLLFWESEEAANVANAVAELCTVGNA